MLRTVYLSGSHIPLVQDMMTLLTEEGLMNIPVVVGGIIPEEDKSKLLQMGFPRSIRQRF